MTGGLWGVGSGAEGVVQGVVDLCDQPGDSGPFWETAEGVSGSVPPSLSPVSGAGPGLGETCLGHLPNALSVRMLAAAMRSLVVAFSSQSLAMSRRISMSSRPLLVTSSMELAKSSAGFDGICWVEVVIGFRFKD